jgi:hypothetical protein
MSENKITTSQQQSKRKPQRTNTKAKKKKKKNQDLLQRSIPVIPQPRSKKNLKMKGVRGKVASNAGGSGSYWYL